MSVGLTQILTSTARNPLRFLGSLQELFEPEINLRYGLRYFARQLGSLNDPPLDTVFAAYNAGSPRRRSDGSFVNQEYVDKAMKAVAKWEERWSAFTLP